MQEPRILTEDVGDWDPEETEPERRAASTRYRGTVAAFLRELGFKVRTHHDTVIGELDALRVEFHYRETVREVYRHLHIYHRGVRRNIDTLRALYPMQHAA